MAEVRSRQSALRRTAEDTVEVLPANTGRGHRVARVRTLLRLTPAGIDAVIRLQKQCRER